jgi:transcriptional regulator GlxA family with amidase domain
VEIVAFSRVQLLDVAGPMQVLATANEVAGEPAPYEVHVVALTAGTITASAGLTLMAEALPAVRTGIERWSWRVAQACMTLCPMRPW